MGENNDKGEWAKTADEGIVPPEDEDAGDAVLGETTGSEEPATEAGIDPAAGDRADAVTDGGAKRPEGAEPDLKDATGGPRPVDVDSAR